MNWLKSLQNILDQNRLAPHDGMSITVDVWNRAHNHHADQLRAALLATRGWGIVSGFEVKPDTNTRRIHVSGGIAIDPEGRLLTLGERTFELDESGTTYIILKYENLVRVTTDAQHDVWEVYKPKKIPNENEYYLELARINRSQVNSAIKIATNPASPGMDELDLRFRITIGAKIPLQLAVVKVDTNVADEHLHGWRVLAGEVAYTTSRPILIDEYTNQSLAEDLDQYDMICLVGRDQFNLDTARKKYLRNYVKAGGILFYESCRQNLRAYPSNADRAFQDWIREEAKNEGISNLQLDPLDASGNYDPLKLTPYLFRRPPRGYDDPNPREFKTTRAIQKGTILFSNLDYGCAFSGRLANNNQPTRTDLREIFEWGHNLLALASRRLR